MIKFEEVTKMFTPNQSAVSKLNLNIEKGSLVSLIGPSGCGKTTAMKMVNRLISPTQGRVLVNGQNVADADPVELCRATGYVVQQIGLFPHMTIAENISVVPKLLKWDEEKIKSRTRELLDLIGLEASRYLNRYPKELSGGQQQRVGVARALAGDPLIMLMDEPFSALDPISREQLQEELKRMQKQLKKTILFVTHDIDEAIEISDYMAIMKQGELLQFDTPGQIFSQQKDPFIRQFLGEKRLKNEVKNV